MKQIRSYSDSKIAKVVNKLSHNWHAVIFPLNPVLSFNINTIKDGIIFRYFYRQVIEMEGVNNEIHLKLFAVQNKKVFCLIIETVS